MKILVLLLAIGVLAKKGKKQVNSLYVLKGSARNEWKHGIPS